MYCTCVNSTYLYTCNVASLWLFFIYCLCLLLINQPQLAQPLFRGHALASVLRVSPKYVFHCITKAESNNAYSWVGGILMIVWVSIALNRTIVDSDWHFGSLRGSYHQTKSTKLRNPGIVWDTRQPLLIITK